MAFFKRSKTKAPITNSASRETLETLRSASINSNHPVEALAKSSGNGTASITVENFTDLKSDAVPKMETPSFPGVQISETDINSASPDAITDELLLPTPPRLQKIGLSGQDALDMYHLMLT